MDQVLVSFNEPLQIVNDIYVMFTETMTLVLSEKDFTVLLHVHKHFLLHRDLGLILVLLGIPAVLSARS